MKNPTSATYRIAMYLHHVKRQTSFTVADLHDAALDAQTWYNEQLSDDIKAKEATIIERHGFTAESWLDILRESSSFYFTPTAEMTACNNEMRQLISRQFIINSPPIARNYIHACVTNAYKRSVLLRNETTHPYIYRINPKYVTHPNFPRS